MTRRLSLDAIHRSRHQLTLHFALDDLRFTASHWYGDVDLGELEARYGAEFMDKVYFHIAAFEINALISLRPDVLDLGAFKRFHTVAFERLWRAVATNAFAEWRYRHDLPHYTGPTFTSHPVDAGAADAGPGPVKTDPAPVEVLLFCGGGKDSLVALKLLERAGIGHGTFGYSHSVYGTASAQHALVDALLDHGAPAQRHRAWIYGDFLDTPVARVHPELGVRHLAAAETPASVFAAVPVLLAHGYRYLVVGHERSANTANLHWAATGEQVNHQWGKSRPAQLLLDAYLRSELVANAGYFSALEPLHDVLIFNLLRDHLDAVGATHSCNRRKPWCLECAKCSYVWLNYLAYLPHEHIPAPFRTNLFDQPANQVWFRQMLGLEAHSPFECVGEVGEARLAFELCRRRGHTGVAMDTFSARVPRVAPRALADQYLTVDTTDSSIPDHLLACLLPHMTAGARRARRWVTDTLTGPVTQDA